MSATLTDVLERREQHIRDLQRLDDAERAKRQTLYPSYTPLAPEPTTHHCRQNACRRSRSAARRP